MSVKGRFGNLRRVQWKGEDGADGGEVGGGGGGGRGSGGAESKWGRK